MKSRRIWINPAIIFLFIVITLFVLLWIVFPHEFIASDQWMYSKSAYNISKGFNFGSTIFDHRLGVVVPVAVIYYFLGVNIFTTNLFPLLVSILLILIIWASLPDTKSKLIGAILSLTSIPLFKSSVHLLPDIIAAAFMALSSIILFNRWKLKEKIGVYWIIVPLFAISCLFIAFLAKESAYWVFPLWIVSMYQDYRSKWEKKTLMQFYLASLTWGVFLVALYFLFCYKLYDDPFVRFKAIQSLTGHHSWSWKNKSTWEFIGRLTTDPLFLLINQHGVFIIVFSMLSLFILPEVVKTWTWYSLFCLLFFWFGSTSFNNYEPMPLVERMTLPILPALIIMSSYSISFLLVKVNYLKKLYTFLLIVFVLAFSGIPFVQYVQNWIGNKSTEAAVMKIVTETIASKPKKDYLFICADSRSSIALDFYFSYQCPKNLQITFAGNLSDSLFANRIYYFYINKSRSSLLNRLYKERTFDEKIKTLNLPIVYRSADLILYRSEDNEVYKQFLKIVDRKKFESI